MSNFRSEDIFQEDDSNEMEDDVGYCSYCKEIVKVDKPYVVQNPSFVYHTDCFNLAQEEHEDEDLDE